MLLSIFQAPCNFIQNLQERLIAISFGVTFEKHPVERFSISPLLGQCNPRALASIYALRSFEPGCTSLRYSTLILSISTERNIQHYYRCRLPTTVGSRENSTLSSSFLIVKNTSICQDSLALSTLTYVGGSTEGFPARHFVNVALCITNFYITFCVAFPNLIGTCQLD